MEGIGEPRSADSYVAQVQTRLERAGYSWTGDAGASFRAVARTSSFQVTKFGFWDVFFVFREFQRLDSGSMQTFMREALQHALANRGVKLPRGLFAGVAVFGVALADEVDEATVRAVREETPPKHWASAEIPVVYDARARRIHYFEKTPVWGAAYYKGYRKQIEQLLAP